MEKEKVAQQLRKWQKILKSIKQLSRETIIQTWSIVGSEFGYLNAFKPLHCDCGGAGGIGGGGEQCGSGAGLGVGVVLGTGGEGTG